MAPKKAKSEEAEKSFTCTDKELSLLLQVIIDYKADKASLSLHRRITTTNLTSAQASTAQWVQKMAGQSVYTMPALILETGTGTELHGWVVQN